MIIPRGPFLKTITRSGGADGGGGSVLPPFYPLFLPDLELYLDSRLGLDTVVDGANVSLWPDQSGHSPGRDAITNLTDPTMGRSGTGLTPNGTETVVWQVPSDDQGLQGRTAFSWPLITTDGYTCYYYGRSITKTLVGWSLINQVAFGGDNANMHLQHVMNTGGVPNSYGVVDDGGGGNPHRFGTSASINGVWQMHAILLPPPNNNSVPLRYFLNGVEQVQTAGPTNYLCSQGGVSAYALGNTLGFNVAFRGNMGTYFVFSRAHTPAQIALFSLWADIYFGLT